MGRAPLILVDIGGAAPAAVTPFPTYWAARFGQPVVTAPPIATPSVFTATSIIGGVLLTVAASDAFQPAYSFERAPDASGAPGTWTEIARQAGVQFTDSHTDTATYWYRARVIAANGQQSAYTAAASAAADYARPNLIPNPTGALGFSGLPALGWIGGLQRQMVANVASLFGQAGPMFACVSPGTSGEDQGFSFKIPLPQVSPVTLSADLLAPDIATGSAFVQLRFLNSSTSEIDAGNRPQINAVNGQTLTHVAVTATPPAGTTQVNVVVRFTGALGANTAVGWRKLKLEVCDHETPWNDAASQMGNQLTNPGSGQTVGNQGNLPPVNWASVGSILSNSPLAYTITSGTGSSTVNVTAAAVTVTAGSYSASYSASSASVSQTNGTTVNYYCYYLDAKGAGGSKTLNVSTNPNGWANQDGVVRLGSLDVTVASGGGGSGGTGSGGGGFCVCGDMWIDSALQAKDAPLGYLFDCCDFPTSGTRIFKRPLLAFEVRLAECVQITTEMGGVWRGGITTPYDTIDGRILRASEMLGELVLTDRGLERVVEVLPIGEQVVYFNHFGGISYACGEDPRHRIFSHNPGAVKP